MQPTAHDLQTHDPLRLYLNAAGQFALLTAEEEADLAKRYQAGLHAERMLANGTRLTPRKRALLARLRLDGERAKDRMVRANLRLVVAQARKFSGRDLDLLELIQEGNLGLMRACEKFDHTKGYKFSTYAVWWIRQALQRGVANKARTIRVPAHIWEIAAKLRRVESELRQKLGRDPTANEVAAKTGISIERLREVHTALRDTISLDRPIGEDGDATMGDLIPDDEASDPAVTAVDADLRARIAEALADLDERERSVLELRYGFIDGRPRTLDEIGAGFGLSRERIRQVEAEALAKLRHPASAVSLTALGDALSAA